MDRVHLLELRSYLEGAMERVSPRQAVERCMIHIACWELARCCKLISDEHAAPKLIEAMQPWRVLVDTFGVGWH